MKHAARAIAVAAAFLSSPANAAHNPVKQMTGCWIGEDFSPVSLLTDASDPKSNHVLDQKMLLKFDLIKGTKYLVLGYIFEWDRKMSMILGPIYENGAYNPALGFLTFGFPKGSLDHVTQPDHDHLLYVHTKSADLSAMSVRPLKRIDCREAARIEKELLARQKALGK